MSRVFGIDFDTGPGSLLSAVENMERNLGPKEMAKAVKKGWSSIRLATERAFKEIPVPRSKKPYPPLHPARVKYGFKPGKLRNSVRFKSTNVRSAQIPRAYLSIHGYPWNFLVNGTKPREIKKGKRKGQKLGFIPDRVPEERFYDGDMPRLFDQAMDTLISQKNVSDVFRR